MKQDEVGALIRAANPIPADDVVDDDPRIIHRIMDTGHSAAVIDFADPRHGRRRWFVGAVAAVTVVGVVGISAGLVHSPRRSERAATPTASTLSSTPRAVSATDYAATLLNQIPLPAGAERRPAQPSPQLSDSAVPTVTGVLATATGWWITPGDISTIFSETNSRLPAYWQIEATTISDTSSAVSTRSAVVVVREPHSAFVAGVGVVVVSAGAELAVRVDVRILADPQRTADQIIPVSDVTAQATLTQSPIGGRSQHWSLSSAAATRLATSINQLQIRLPFEPQMACPAPVGRAEIAFTRGSSVITFRVGSGGCPGSELATPDGSVLSFDNGSEVLTVLLSELGLSADWFSR